MKKVNYRDSGNGQYVSKAKAMSMPANQVEKEQVKPAPKSSPKKGKRG
jgi:hypothetical protein